MSAGGSVLPQLTWLRFLRFYVSLPKGARVSSEEELGRLLAAFGVPRDCDFRV